MNNKFSDDSGMNLDSSVKSNTDYNEEVEKSYNSKDDSFKFDEKDKFRNVYYKNDEGDQGNFKFGKTQYNKKA